MRRLCEIAMALGVLGCGATPMIEMPYQPLAAPESGSGPVDVIRDLQAPGQLPPLNTVRLPEGDVEFRFGIVGHMVLGATHTIVRVVRSGGVAKGEVWCHRLAWELRDSLGRMPHQISRTVVESTPDWGAILDSITAIGLMRYSPDGAALAPVEPSPGEPSSRSSERPLILRHQTDQPSILFEGREGAAYRSFSIYGHTPETRPEWPRVQAAILAVWGEQKYACQEFSPPDHSWDPGGTTRWRVVPDSAGIR